MILDKIIERKRLEVRSINKKHPLSAFVPGLKRSERSFRKAIGSGFSLIAEIKKGSPSEGIINKNFSIEKIAGCYEKNRHVKAISVLTDRKFFFMGKTCLKEVGKYTKKPLLRKDFIIDEYQVYESRFYHADAILLIARILTKEKIRKFIEIAKRYGMDCLVEIHNKEELKRLPDNVEIIGINNRNLDTLEIDLGTTLDIVDNLPKGKIIVTESGYDSNKEINKVRDKVNAVLIGTSILKAKDINNKINGLMG